MKTIIKEKTLQVLHIGFFIITISGVGLTSLFNKPFQTDAFSMATLMNGENARNLENSYDDNMFIKELSVNLWAAIEYKLFDEGKQGLVVGKEGWLFTGEEFNTRPNSEYAYKTNVDFIKWVNDELVKDGVTLVVVPVPAKARLYKEKLKAIKPELLHQEIYNDLISELKQHSVHVTDSLSALIEKKTKEQLFLRTDTHWTPAGAATVATTSAQYIKSNITIALNTKSYITEHVSNKKHKGDLLNYLPLSPWFDALLPELDELGRYETHEESEEALDDLFGDTNEAVALVGTSYSANQDWNFIGALKQALATDIINYAETGQGPIQPMMRFLKRYKNEMPDLELLIWEIPERYLSVTYDEVYAERESLDMQTTLIAQESKLNPRSL